MPCPDKINQCRDKWKENKKQNPKSLFLTGSYYINQSYNISAK